MDASHSFGQWLRQRRKALGLTHATLADGAHCSVSALRKIEQDERHPSHHLAERLAVCLQIPEAERKHFIETARGERRVARLTDVSPIPLPPLAAYSLPTQLTSFIGRQRELDELRRLLGTARLLTLTGAGGSGKTRLALELARGLVDQYRDGIGFVDLAPITDPALVAQTAASSLRLAEQPGRSPIDLLSEHLESRTLLLLLDNCEHLIAACAALAERLLKASPGLRIVATSRESLGVAGEVAWPVPSLSTPEAARLFVDRALTSRPSFALTEANAPAVTRICQQLEGIPLAIELAAARVKMMSVEQIGARLSDSLALLANAGRPSVARHQTLRAAIDWSYEHLTDAERVLFRRLSVFAGGSSLEAVEKVGAGAGVDVRDVLDLLSRLVDKSLVIVEPDVGSSARYRMLATIREYARERLEEAGDAAPTRDRHLDWFLTLAEQCDNGLRGTDPHSSRVRLEQEHDNLRTALGWSRGSATRVEAGLRLAGALSLFWGQHGYLREGLESLEAVLAVGADAAADARALALHAAGSLAWRLGDIARARGFLEASLALRRELSIPLDLVRTLSMLGVVLSAASGPGDLDRARACFAESLPLARGIDDLAMVAHSLNALGEIARSLGNLAEAQTFYTQALEASRGRSNAHAAGILLNLGLVAFVQDDMHAARGLFEESLTLFRTVGEQGSLAACLDGLAGVHAVCGDANRAAQLLGAADALRTAINEPVQSTDRADHGRFVAAARRALDEASFAQAWAIGARLRLDEAVELALARV